MASDKVKVLYHYNGVFYRNAFDGSIIYKHGTVRVTLLSRNDTFQHLKSRLVKIIGCKGDNMKIMYGIDNQQGKHIYIDVQDDDDVSCMLLEVSTIELFIASQVHEQTTNAQVTRETENTCNFTTEMSQPSILTQTQFTLNEPSSSLRHPNENNVDASVAIVDPNFIIISDDDLDDIQRIDYHTVPLRKGQDFGDVDECRSYLTEYAIKHNFVMKIVKSDQKRVTAKCSKEGCTWRVHCSRICNTNFFRVKSLFEQHSCGGPLGRTHQPAARAKWVSSKIKGHLQDQPKLKPKDIMSDIQREHGVNLTYRQAWLGKEFAVRELQGSYEESLHNLPAYLFKLRMTNLGTVTYIQTDSLYRFERLFIAFNPCVQGFISGCRPFIGLDGTFLKGKYMGIFLAAVGLDANGNIFPIAFAVVEKENYSTWSCFLRILKERLEFVDINRVVDRLTIISDRQKGLLDAITDVFPTSYQGFCMRHLVANFRKQWRNDLLRRLFWRAAHALTVNKYDKAMAKIKFANEDAFNWITEVPPHFWATVYFPGQRYGHLTSNISESFNSWIEDIRDKPIIQLVDGIRLKVMTKFYEQKTNANKCTSVIAPTADTKLKKELEKSRFLSNVIHANGMWYEIHADQAYAVDLQTSTCSCNYWQAHGIPCGHAIAAINHGHLEPSAFCSRYFHADYYRAAFVVGFSPMPDNFIDPLPMKEARIVLPPSTQRPARRPRVRRRETCPLDKVPYKCTRCGEFGHNRRSCKEPLP